MFLSTRCIVRLKTADPFQCFVSPFVIDLRDFHLSCYKPAPAHKSLRHPDSWSCWEGARSAQSELEQTSPGEFLGFAPLPSSCRDSHSGVCSVRMGSMERDQICHSAPIWFIQDAWTSLFVLRSLLALNDTWHVVLELCVRDGLYFAVNWVEPEDAQVWWRGGCWDAALSTSSQSRHKRKKSVIGVLEPWNNHPLEKKILKEPKEVNCLPKMPSALRKWRSFLQGRMDLC